MKGTTGRPNYNAVSGIDVANVNYSIHKTTIVRFNQAQCMAGVIHADGLYVKVLATDFPPSSTAVDHLTTPKNNQTQTDQYIKHASRQSKPTTMKPQDNMQIGGNTTIYQTTSNS